MLVVKSAKVKTVILRIWFIVVYTEDFSVRFHIKNMLGTFNSVRFCDARCTASTTVTLHDPSSPPLLARYLQRRRGPASRRRVLRVGPAPVAWHCLVTQCVTPSQYLHAAWCVQLPLDTGCVLCSLFLYSCSGLLLFWLCARRSIFYNYAHINNAYLSSAQSWRVEFVK